jgi:hypothetical protein
MSNEPKKFTIKPEGRLSVKEAPDGSIAASTDKHVNIDLGTIKSVGIENLIDVEVHEINWLFDSVSHYIRFFGGGEVRFSYNSAGQLLDLTGKGVTTVITDGDRLLFRRIASGEA